MMSGEPPLYLEDTMAGPPAGTLIAKLEDLPKHGGKDILFKDGSYQTNIFVQHCEQGVFVYENRCPHAGTPLNMFGDKFLNMDQTHLICRTHGALFEITNGKCIAGPCKGQTLRPVAIEIRDGGIYSA